MIRVLFRLPPVAQLIASVLLVVIVHLVLALIFFGSFDLSLRRTEFIELSPSIGVRLVASPSLRAVAWYDSTLPEVVSEVVSEIATERAKPVPDDGEKTDTPDTESTAASDTNQLVSAPSLLDELIVEHVADGQRSEDLILVQSYVSAMVTHIENSWLRPLSARSGMSVRVRVSIVPTGELVGISLLEGSGDPAFDRSALQAIEQSTPLPVPKDIQLFDTYFRNIQLVFSPDDL